MSSSARCVLTVAMASPLAFSAVAPFVSETSISSGFEMESPFASAAVVASVSKTSVSFTTSVVTVKLMVYQIVQFFLFLGWSVG